MIKQLNELLFKEQYDDFFSSLPKIVKLLEELEKQELLINILRYHYHIEMKDEFKKAFDLIIGMGLNLNFNNDSDILLPTLINNAPYIKLFDYFISKGANINLIIDDFAFSSEQEIIDVVIGEGVERYSTCLDYAEEEIERIFTVSQNPKPPIKKIKGDSNQYINDHSVITISKYEYLRLYEKTEFIFDLFCTDKLIDHIRKIGGKKYGELK